jgi:hypothetical protein
VDFHTAVFATQAEKGGRSAVRFRFFVNVAVHKIRIRRDSLRAQWKIILFVSWYLEGNDGTFQHNTRSNVYVKCRSKIVLSLARGTRSANHVFGEAAQKHLDELRPTTPARGVDPVGRC